MRQSRNLRLTIAATLFVNLSGTVALAGEPPLASLGSLISASQPTVESSFGSSMQAAAGDGTEYPLATLNAASWTAEDVANWAAAHSPTANLLEAERAALGQALDCKDEEQRAQIGLLQAVSRELALHSRQESAADALDVYYQAQAAILQMEILRQAAPRLDNLEQMAETAETLELPDGDVDELADRRMAMEDQWFEADLGLQRLRNQLASLTGQNSDTAQLAFFASPLPDATGIEQDAAAHIPEAMAKRRDLKAIETLCRCTTAKTLPAARQLLGALVPGLGLQVAASGGGCGLLGGRNNSEDEDLACRKAQCNQLARSRRSQIEAQIRDAVLQLREATSRLEVARRRAILRAEMAERAKRAIDLEQEPAGSDQLAELESLEQQAEVIRRELAVAKAIVALNRAKGTVLP